ncbi:MAG TPA: PAS domain S-box protein [Candidatus Obscuribacterales bacterium]
MRPFLREHIVFAVHDLLQDPPFSQMDLVCCRNLLIYLRPEFQQRLFQMFGYAVRPGGWLMLGPSETLPENSGFEERERSWKLYQRLSNPSLRPLWPSLSSTRSRPALWEPQLEHRRLAEQVQMQLLAAYVPRGMVFRENYELMHISGMEQYLRLPSGAASLHVLDMLPPAWAVPLSLGVGSLLQNGQAVYLPDVVQDQGRSLSLQLELLPLTGSRERLVHARVLEDSPAPAAGPLPVELNLNRESQERLLLLEQELRRHQAHLQVTIEELAASNAELQATNEELQSTNEELQTVNADYHQKMDELSAAHDDQHNLLQSTEIATLFLDEHLRIRRFTQAFHRILPLLPQDIGRPLQHFHSSLLTAELLDEIAEVGRSHLPRERALEAPEGQSYMLRIHPFRSQQAVYKGVVLTFVDITQLMQTRHALEAYQDELSRTVGLYNLIAHNIRDVIGLMSLSGELSYLSPSVAELLGYSAEALTGRSLTELVHSEDQAELSDCLAQLGHLGGSRRLEHRLLSARGSAVWVETDLRTITNDNGQPQQLLATLRDISPRREAEARLRKSQDQLKAIFENSRDGLLLLDTDLGVLAFNPEVVRWLADAGLPPVQAGQSFLASVPADEGDWYATQLKEVLRSGQPFAYETAAGSDSRWYEVICNPVYDDGGRASGLCLSGRDITERKQAELALRESEARLQAMFNHSDAACILLDRELRVLAFNELAFYRSTRHYPRPLQAGALMAELLEPTAAAELEAWLQPALAGETLEREYASPHAGEADIWYALHCTPVRAADSTITGLCLSTRDISTSKAAELALRQSEAQLQAIFNHSDSSLTLLDTQLNILAFNHKAYESSLQSCLEPLQAGRCLLDLLSPEIAEATLGYMQPALAGHVIEFDYQPPEEPEQWYQLICTPVRDGEGRISGVCVSTRNITASKRADLAVRQSEARLRAIFDNSHDSLMLMDRDLILLAHNPKADEWARRQEMGPLRTGMCMDELTTPERRAAYRTMIGTVLEGKTIEYELTYTNSQDESYWYSATLNPVREDDGSISGVCINASDITGRKQAELAIRQSEANLQAIFQNVRDSLLLVDRAQRVLAFNSKVMEWTIKQERPPVSLGCFLPELAQPEHRADYEAQIQRVLDEGLSIEYERAHTNSQGKSSWFLVTMSPVREADGSISGACISGLDITGRKQAEIAIQQSEAQLQAIFQNVRDSLLLLDQDFRLLAFNEKAVQWSVLQQQPPLRLGKSLLEAAPADRRERFATQLDRVLAGENIEYETVYQIPDGQTTWYLVGLNPVREAGGSVSGICISGRDITERKQAELELLRLNQRLQKSKEIAHLGYWEFDTVSGHLHCSAQSCRIFGFEPGPREVELSALLAQVHPDDRSRLQAAWEAAWSGEAPLNLIHRVVIDGQIRHLRELALPMSEAGFGRIEGTVQDISEWYQTEQELSQLFELSTDLICICDLDGHFHKLNPAFSSVLGYSEAEILAQTFLDLVHRQDLPATRKEFQKLRRGQGSLQVESRTRCADGSWRWLAWKAATLADTGMVYCSGRDITERKQAEAQLAEYADRLTLILESITDAFVTLDSEGRFTYANQAAMRLLQMDQDKLMGHSLWALFPVSEGPLFADRYRWALIYQEPVHFEVHNQRLGAWLEVSVYPSEENFSVFFRDISEIKLSRSVTELERELLARYAAGREPLQTLLDETLQQVQQLLPGVRCLLQVPEAGRLKLISAPDLDPAALAVVANQPLTAGHGTCAAAALQLKAALAPDLQQDPHWEKLRGQVLASGIQAAWSYPVLSPEQELLATFACFFDTPHKPRLPETLLAERVSKLLAVILENQHSNAILHESHLRYELVARATNDAVWDWNLKTDRVYWNRVLEFLCGYGPDEIGPDIAWRLESIHPDDRARVEQGIQEHINQRTPNWQAEYRIRCANGDWLDVLDRGYLLLDEAGEPVRMIGAMQDISERKAFEASMRLMNQRYEFAALATRDAIWDWDLSTDAVYWNPAISELCGYPPDEVGQTLDWWLEAIHPNDRPRIRSSLQNHIAGCQSHWQESYRFRCADGSYRQVLNRGYLICDSNGKAIRMIGAMQEAG